jgi:hypothetical protein
LREQEGARGQHSQQVRHAAAHSRLGEGRERNQRQHDQLEGHDPPGVAVRLADGHHQRVENAVQHALCVLVAVGRRVAGRRRADAHISGALHREVAERRVILTRQLRLRMRGASQRGA